MKNFYIEVSNGLLTKDHRERIGGAIWEFLWLLDRITKIDDKGQGWILGGKPIHLDDLADQMGSCRDTISRNLNRLKKEGYISITRTPHGLSIRVANSQKRFRKGMGIDKKRFDKNAETLDKNVELDTAEMSNVNKDSINTSKTINQRHAEQSSADIVKIINLFKEVNPSYERWFANKTQRAAIQNLLRIHGPPKVEQVILILPQSNKIPYVPTITTPVQLEEKWAQLEAALIKKKAELQAKKPKVIFS